MTNTNHAGCKGDLKVVQNTASKETGPRPERLVSIGFTNDGGPVEAALESAMQRI